ncbi:MAG: MerR family transcriptional regulator [Bacillota bacterium]|nr:MerR family transcriptional regulator [Bacillota bacterium]
MLKIGEFSKLSRVSIRMLRHYNEIGLLTPTEIDKFTGYRYYSEDQLPVLGRITALRDMGFGLSAVGEILRCYDDKEALDRHLSLKEAELRELSTEIAQRLRLLETARKRLRKDDKAMNYNVTLKTLPQRYVASVRMTIPSYDQEGMLWSVLVSETAPLNVVDDDPCYCSVTFFDGEHKESDVDLEAQKTVKGQYPDTEHVKFKTVPPVTFASATYQGPYSQIGDVNVAVAAWVRDNGYEYDGPTFNIYHVSPHETSNPGEFVTEVCYPVKKK